MTEKNASTEDYISFSSLKMFFIHVLRLFFQTLRLTGDIFKKNYILLVSGIILGGAIGWLLRPLVGTNYKVYMIVEYNILDKKAYMNIVDQVGLLVRSGSTDRLATQLGLSPALAGNVNSLETENLAGLTLEKDTTTMTRFFRIKAGLHSPAGADSIATALLAYINALPYLKREMEEQQKIMHDRLSFLQAEMTRIDSLKREYSRSLTAVKISSGYYNTVFDPASLYKESNTLDSLKAEISRYLIHRDKALSGITTFRPGDHPQNISTPVFIAAWIVLGFLLAFIIAALRELKKKIHVV
jgi:hypothetical protein